MVVAGKQDRSSGIAERQEVVAAGKWEEVVAAGKWEHSFYTVEQLDVVVDSTMALVVGQQGHIGHYWNAHRRPITAV